MTDQEVIDSQDNAEKELIKSAFNKSFLFAGFTQGRTDKIWLLGTLSAYEIMPRIGITRIMRVIDLRTVTL